MIGVNSMKNAYIHRLEALCVSLTPMYPETIAVSFQDLEPLPYCHCDMVRTAGVPDLDISLILS